MVSVSTERGLLACKSDDEMDHIHAIISDKTTLIARAVGVTLHPEDHGDKVIVKSKGKTGKIQTLGIIHRKVTMREAIMSRSKYQS